MRRMRIKEEEFTENKRGWNKKWQKVTLWSEGVNGWEGGQVGIQSKHSILLSSPFVYLPLPMSLFLWLLGCAGVEGTGRTRTPAWVLMRVTFRLSRDQSLCVFVCVCALFCMFLGCRFLHLSSASPPCVP